MIRTTAILLGLFFGGGALSAPPDEIPVAPPMQSTGHDAPAIAPIEKQPVTQINHARTRLRLEGLLSDAARNGFVELASQSSQVEHADPEAVSQIAKEEKKTQLPNIDTHHAEQNSTSSQSGQHIKLKQDYCALLDPLIIPFPEHQTKLMDEIEALQKQLIHPQLEQRDHVSLKLARLYLAAGFYAEARAAIDEASSLQADIVSDMARLLEGNSRSSFTTLRGAAACGPDGIVWTAMLLKQGYSKKALQMVHDAPELFDRLPPIMRRDMAVSLGISGIEYLTDDVLDILIDVTDGDEVVKTSGEKLLRSIRDYRRGNVIAMEKIKRMTEFESPVQEAALAYLVGQDQSDSIILEDLYGLSKVRGVGALAQMANAMEVQSLTRRGDYFAAIKLARTKPPTAIGEIASQRALIGDALYQALSADASGPQIIALGAFVEHRTYFDEYERIKSLVLLGARVALAFSLDDTAMSLLSNPAHFNTDEAALYALALLLGGNAKAGRDMALAHHVTDKDVLAQLYIGTNDIMSALTLLEKGTPSRDDILWQYASLEQIEKAGALKPRHDQDDRPALMRMVKKQASKVRDERLTPQSIRQTIDRYELNHPVLKRVLADG